MTYYIFQFSYVTFGLPTCVYVCVCKKKLSAEVTKEQSTFCKYHLTLDFHGMNLHDVTGIPKG